MDNEISADVLVVGGGMGACFAAIKARDLGLEVVLVDKGNLGRSGFSPMLSGILHYFNPEEDDYEAWYREGIEVGDWLNDQDRLRHVITDTTDRIRELDGWGVQFQKEGGRLIRKPAAGSLNVRNALLSNSGFQLMSVLRGEVLRRGVRVVERVMVTDLLTSDGEVATGERVTGAVGFNVRTGAFHVFQARATIIATGCACSTGGYARQANLSGDGKAMAFRAGAELRNLDFIRWNPTAAGQTTSAGHNILGGEGAFFVNARGERFLKKWDPKRMERAPRIVVSRAIYVEEKEGRGPAYLDATHLSEAAYSRIEKCIPIVIRNFEARGLDFRKDLIPYTVFLADVNSAAGIRINASNETTVPGLFAVGDAADQAGGGTFSAIGGGILAASGGCHAAAAARSYCAEAAEPVVDARQVQVFKKKIFAPMERQSGTRHQEIRAHYLSIIREGLLGPVKSEKKLRKAIDVAQQIREEDIPKLMAGDFHELARCIGVGNELLMLFEVSPRCSRFRTESRGTHYREDYPERDDANWLKWVLARRENEAIKVWAEPVPFGEYRLKPGAR